MQPKILSLIQKCGSCPRRHGDRCGEVDEVILDSSRVAPFCTLSDYPNRTIADMEATIKALRENDNTSFPIAVLSLIATRLGTNLCSDYMGIDIPLADGNVVHLPYEGLTFETDLHWTICFVDRGNKYRLRMGDCSLHMSVSVPGYADELWKICELKHT